MRFVYRAVGRLTAALLFAAGLSLAGGLIVLSSTPAYAQNITVRGNQRIEADAVRAHFVTGPGESLTSEKIDEAVKAL
jgi:outer membrane protein insertion porin family